MFSTPATKASSLSIAFNMLQVRDAYIWTQEMVCKDRDFYPPNTVTILISWVTQVSKL